MTQEDFENFRRMFPIWNKLSATEQNMVKKSLKIQNFRKGESLHRGEEDCSGLIVVRSGLIRAFILSESGKEITIYRLLERDTCIFSASCIMKNIQFDVFLTAETDTSVFLIPTSVFQSLKQKSLAVSDFTNQLMASRFSDVMWVLEQVVFSRFDKRLASFLLEQSSLENTDTLHITHDEIARHLGSAREVVTRMLKYFQQEDILSLHRGGITITNAAKLVKFTQG